MDWKSLFGRRIFKLVSVGTIIASAFLVQPYRPVVLVGNSMNPTYQNQEWAIATTDVQTLAVGDIVVIQGADSPIVKRIAHLPGGWVRYVRFGNEWMFADTKTKELKHPERFPFKMVRVPEGYVFVLGDNPIASIDSRQLGVLPIASIKSKLVDPKVAQPLSKLYE
ncbi:MAG: signal peptidase I [Chlorobia bacterium]|nr:signal peptidase I [Fimbriimonadaceae bacterium]